MKVHNYIKARWREGFETISDLPSKDEAKVKSLPEPDSEEGDLVFEAGLMADLGLVFRMYFAARPAGGARIEPYQHIVVLPESFDHDAPRKQMAAAIFSLVYGGGDDAKKQSIQTIVDRASAGSRTEDLSWVKEYYLTGNQLKDIFPNDVAPTVSVAASGARTPNDAASVSGPVIFWGAATPTGSPANPASADSSSPANPSAADPGSADSPAKHRGPADSGDVQLLPSSSGIEVVDIPFDTLIELRRIRLYLQAALAILVVLLLGMTLLVVQELQLVDLLGRKE